MFKFLNRFFIFVLFITVSSCCAKTLVVNINKSVFKRIKIAVVLTQDTNNTDLINAKEIVENDLNLSGLFSLIPSNISVEKYANLNQKITYPAWQSVGCEYLVVVSAKLLGNKLNVEFKIYNTISNRLLNTATITANINDIRHVFHLISNSVYKIITGDNGYFDQRLLFIELENAQKKNRKYKLSLMDVDGYNKFNLTNGNNIIIGPRMSPNGKTIIFFSYKEKLIHGKKIPYIGTLYKATLNKNTLTDLSLLAEFKGTAYAARFAPDGNSLIFSISANGMSSIYSFDFKHNNLKRLTNNFCIDTSPCYSPDGNYIVFNSDRSGTQQNYIMHKDGSNIKRLTYGKGRYATPVWSPRGDLIAFCKFGTGDRKFYIGVMKTDGSFERLVASGHMVESPSWAQNGRVLVYTEQDYSHNYTISMVDIAALGKTKLHTPQQALNPEFLLPTNVKNL